MHFIEQSSRGIPTIIKNGNGVFLLGTSFIKCVIPYNIVDKNKMEKMNGALPTHEPLLQTCAHTPKPPINTSVLASIFLIGTKNFKITVSYCTYSHFFSIFEWSKPT